MQFSAAVEIVHTFKGTDRSNSSETQLTSHHSATNRTIKYICLGKFESLFL